MTANGYAAPAPGEGVRSSLLDATSIVWTHELLVNRRVGVSTVFALANLIDCMVLTEKQYSLAPAKVDDPQFRSVLDQLDFHPGLLQVEEGMDDNLTATVAAENAGRNLDFTVVHFDENNQPGVYPEAVDYAAALPFEDHAWRIRAERESNAPISSGRILEDEVQMRYRSVHTGFGVENSDELLRQIVGLGRESPPIWGLSTLAFRSELYLDLSAYYELPYFADPLRSYLIAQGTRRSYANYLVAARALGAVVDDAVDARRKGLDRVLPSLPALPISTPGLLNLVLTRSRTTSDVLQESRELAGLRSARRLRGEVADLQSQLLRYELDPAKVKVHLEQIKQTTTDFANEAGTGRFGHHPADAPAQILIQGFVAYASTWMTGHNAIQAGEISTASLLASMGLDKARRFLRAYRLAFLKNPLIEATALRSVRHEVRRIFGSELSEEDLQILRTLRGLPG